MRLANYADFETEGGLYWPPYQDFVYFTQRAEYLAEHHSGKRILLAGCGWGFTVLHARALGLEVWGVDASTYALSHAREIGLLREVIYGDITTKANMPELEVDLVVTEDVYPMLTLDEIERAQEVLHSYAPVAHWITPVPETPHPAIVTRRSAPDWIELVTPDDVLEFV